MISVDLAVVKQVVSKVLYEAINVLSKSFMGFLGKICLSRRIMHCNCSSPDEQMGQSKHGALVSHLRRPTPLESNGKADPSAAPVLCGPQTLLSPWVPV